MANEIAIIETRAIKQAEKIESLVTEARKKVASVANTAQVYMRLAVTSLKTNKAARYVPNMAKVY